MRTVKIKKDVSTKMAGKEVRIIKSNPRSTLVIDNTGKIETLPNHWLELVSNDTIEIVIKKKPIKNKGRSSRKVRKIKRK